jgi:hypothetical protein
MLRLMLVMIFWSLFGYAMAQGKRVLEQLDSVDAINSLLPLKVNARTYYQQSFSEKFDPTSYDAEKADAVFFACLNSTRSRRTKAMFTFSPELYQIAGAYLKGVYKQRFEANGYSIQVNKPLPQAAKLLNYKKGILSAFVFRIPVMDFRGYGDFYFDKDIPEGPALFAGKRKPNPTEQNEETTRKEIPFYSYGSLSKQLVSGLYIPRMLKYLKSKSYSEMAVRFQVDSTTLRKHMIPMGNVILLLSGNRLQQVQNVKAPKDDVLDTLQVKN